MKTYLDYKKQIDDVLDEYLQLITPTFALNIENAMQVFGAFSGKLDKIVVEYTKQFPNEAIPNKIDVQSRLALAKWIEKNRLYLKL